jgi:hypothetical protein
VEVKHKELSVVEVKHKEALEGLLDMKTIPKVDGDDVLSVHRRAQGLILIFGEWLLFQYIRVKTTPLSNDGAIRARQGTCPGVPDAYAPLLLALRRSSPAGLHCGLVALTLVYASRRWHSWHYCTLDGVQSARESRS